MPEILPKLPVGMLLVRGVVRDRYLNIKRGYVVWVGAME
jgi:hypothetical protein